MEQQNVFKSGSWGSDLTSSAITGRGNNSRDLKGRTEGRTIKKVVGGKAKNHAREGD